MVETVGRKGTREFLVSPDTFGNTLSHDVLKVEDDKEPAASGLRAHKAHANTRDQAQKCEQGAARYKRRAFRSGGERRREREGERRRDERAKDEGL